MMYGRRFVSMVEKSSRVKLSEVQSDPADLGGLEGYRGQCSPSLTLGIKLSICTIPMERSYAVLSCVIGGSVLRLTLR